MNDSRNDFLPYIATNDGRLTDLVYELLEFVGRKKGDHVHCELCWVTICDVENLESEKEAYYCTETGCWLCKRCFSDFSQIYNWKIQDSKPDSLL